MIKLRPYQDESIEALRAKFREGFTAIVLVLMTGAGKTLCAASIMKGALDNGSRLLFVAQRRELIAQTYMKLIEMEVPEDKIGVIMGSGKIHVKGGKVINALRKDAPIQIASIQTLRNRYHPPADIVFSDECFPAGTMIDGKPIESILVGDTVSSWNENTNEIEQKKVLRCFRSKPSSMVRVHLSSGRSIVCTSGHPFFTRNGYVQAIKLEDGEVLFGCHTEKVRSVWSDVPPSFVEQYDDSNVLAGVQSKESQTIRDSSARVTLQELREICASNRRECMEVVLQNCLLQQCVQERVPCSSTDELWNMQYAILSREPDSSSSSMFANVQGSSKRDSQSQTRTALQSVWQASSCDWRDTLAFEHKLRLLQRQLQECGSSENKREVRTDPSGLQSEICTTTHARTQSYAYGWSQRQDDSDSSPNRSQATCSWWQRSRYSYSTSKTIKGTGSRLDYRSSCNNWMGTGSGESISLQYRYCQSTVDDSDRSRRIESRYDPASSFRRKKRQITPIERVDRVEVLQRGSNGMFEGLHLDSHVYNIEVEENHNYFANDILVHNCHACLSQSFLNLKAKYPKAIHIGLTATPFRYGGKGLHSYYDAMVIGALPSMLIRDGYIVNPSVWTVPTDQKPDLTDVKTTNGDFNQKQLAKACNKNTLVGSIVEHWKSHAGNRRTICFPVDIAHSRHIVSDFIDAGVSAEHLDGTTPSDMRDAILRRLESGETLVVSSVGCLQEGFDCPPVKCIILARPTKSTGLFLQMSGRILRPWNDTSAIILDHAGCVLMHGLPSEDREFTLEDTGLNRKSDSTQTCKKCFAVFESGVEACPACGMPVPVGGGGGGDRTLKQIDGQLVEYSDADRQLERRAYWDQLCRLSVQGSHKPGWVKSEFKKKFGHYPPKSYPPPAERPRTPGEIDVLRAKMARVARERGLPGAWVDKKVTAATTPAQAQLVLMSHASKARPEPPVPRVAAVIASRVETVVSESEIGKWDI